MEYKAKPKMSNPTVRQWQDALEEMAKAQARVKAIEDGIMDQVFAVIPDEFRQYVKLNRRMPIASWG